MSRTATQLAGNATSIFQAWLDLKRQTGLDSRTTATKDDSSSGNDQRRSGA